MSDIEIARVSDILERTKNQGAEAIFYGLDIGRARDHSALAILVRYLMQVDRAIQSRYYCVYLKRYSLHTPYEVVEADAERWWRWADASGYKRYFTMDMTGVGAPVLEGIRRRRVRAIGLTITGGMQETNPVEGQYNIPKEALVTEFLRTVQMGRFKGYGKHIPLWDAFQKELGTFGYKTNKDTSTIQYESLKSVVHDDLVNACALPVWYGERIVPYRSPVKGLAADIETYDPFRQESSIV